MIVSSLIDICCIDSFRISIWFVDIIIHIWCLISDLSCTHYPFLRDNCISVETTLWRLHHCLPDSGLSNKIVRNTLDDLCDPARQLGSWFVKPMLIVDGPWSIKLDIKPVFIAVSSLFILCCKNNSGKLSRGARPFILKISTANYGLLWFWFWWWSRYKLMLRWWELGPGVTLGDVIRRTGNIPGQRWGCDMVITSCVRLWHGHYIMCRASHGVCTPVTSNTHSKLRLSMFAHITASLFPA